MLEDGLSYPVRGDWIGRTIIGSVLIFFGWLILPAILVYGYYINVLEETIAGDDEPPAFEEWGDMLVKGLVGMIISFVYTIIPVVVYSVFAFVVVGASFGIGGDEGVGAGLVAMFITLVMFIPLLLLIYYLIPAPLANYAREGSIGAAFDFGTLKEVWLSADYLVALLMPIVVGLIASVAVFVLSITVIGLLLVPFVYFYSYVAIFRMFGLAFEKAAPTTGTPSPQATPAED